jgi:hypothetical protein
LDQEGVGGWSSAVSYDLFNFIFFFSLDVFRGWHREVLAMDFIFTIRGKEGSMKHIMNLPSLGKSELVDNRRYDFGNNEGSFLFQGKFRI